MLASLMAAAALQQSGMFTANELWESCRQADASNQSVCFGYISAVVDTYQTFHILAGEGTECIPAGVTYEQFRDVAVDYLRSNPRNRHLPAAGIVLISLSEAYGCQIGPAQPFEDDVPVTLPIEPRRR